MVWVGAHLLECCCVSWPLHDLRFQLQSPTQCRKSRLANVWYGWPCLLMRFDGCRHLDADEAIVRGAAFYAANLSTTFRLAKKFGMADGTVYPVTFQVTFYDHHLDLDLSCCSCTLCSIEMQLVDVHCQRCALISVFAELLYRELKASYDSAWLQPGTSSKVDISAFHPYDLSCNGCMHQLYSRPLPVCIPKKRKALCFFPFFPSYPAVSIKPSSREHL